MRGPRYISAPLLASTALEIFTGCQARQQCVSNDTHQIAAMSFCRDSAGTPVTTHSYHLETVRGGFGDTLGPVLFGTAAAALLIRAGSGG